jgi:hypothetical protein
MSGEHRGAVSSRLPERQRLFFSITSLSSLSHFLPYMPAQPLQRLKVRAVTKHAPRKAGGASFAPSRSLKIARVTPSYFWQSPKTGNKCASSSFLLVLLKKILRRFPACC